MPVQRNRSTTDHAVRIAFSDRLHSVLMAFDRIAFAGDCLAVNHIGIRTCRNRTAMRRERITHHNDLTNHVLFSLACGSVPAPCAYIPIV